MVGVSWVADKGGFGGEYHPIRCIAVEMYEQVYEPVETIEEYPDTDPLVRCPLCEHEIDPGEERYAHSLESWHQR